jgi:hypothetical protein
LNSAANSPRSKDALLNTACARLRNLRVELPAKAELQRVVNSALNGFFQDIQRRISDALAAEIQRPSRVTKTFSGFRSR